MSQEARCQSIPPPDTLSPKRLESIERDVSREFLLELVDLFVGDVQTRLQSLADAVNGRETVKAADVAHALQGAAASLGVLRMRHVAARLEDHVKQSDWRASDATLARLISEFAHVRGVLGALHARVSLPPDEK
jgi:HPt (histidine-containing phosphotransfer) domain-containing protein